MCVPSTSGAPEMADTEPWLARPPRHQKQGLTGGRWAGAGKKGFSVPGGRAGAPWGGV